MSSWANKSKTLINEGASMYSTNSPLEQLAAFAIVFAAGIISSVGLQKYIARVTRNAKNS